MFLSEGKEGGAAFNCSYFASLCGHFISMLTSHRASGASGPAIRHRGPSVSIRLLLHALFHRVHRASQCSSEAANKYFTDLTALCVIYLVVFL